MKKVFYLISLEAFVIGLKVEQARALDLRPSLTVAITLSEV